jgi:hypothetical protein
VGKPERKGPLGRPRYMWEKDEKIERMVWTEFICLRIWKSGELL